MRSYRAESPNTPSPVLPRCSAIRRVKHWTLPSAMDSPNSFNRLREASFALEASALYGKVSADLGNGPTKPGPNRYSRESDMRDIIKKTTAVAMVAAAALSLAACKSETTNTTENVSMTDMNAEGSMNDMAAT